MNPYDNSYFQRANILQQNAYRSLQPIPDQILIIDQEIRKRETQLSTLISFGSLYTSPKWTAPDKDRNLSEWYPSWWQEVPDYLQAKPAQKIRRSETIWTKIVILKCRIMVKIGLFIIRISK